MIMVIKNMDGFENIRARMVRNSKGSENEGKVDMEENDSYFVKLDTGNSKQDTYKNNTGLGRFELPTHGLRVRRSTISGSLGSRVLGLERARLKTSRHKTSS